MKNYQQHYKQKFRETIKNGTTSSYDLKLLTSNSEDTLTINLTITVPSSAVSPSETVDEIMKNLIGNGYVPTNSNTENTIQLDPQKPHTLNYIANKQSNPISMNIGKDLALLLKDLHNRDSGKIIHEISYDDNTTHTFTWGSTDWIDDTNQQTLYVSLGLHFKAKYTSMPITFTFKINGVDYTFNATNS